MQLSELAATLDAHFQGPDQRIHSIALDSRTVQPGQLYVALKGDSCDGHDFVAEAAAKGAVAALVEKTTHTHLPQIQVTDTRQALWQLAAFYRSLIDQPVVAVTGSCGKTTTKALIQSVLSQHGTVLASEKSFNTALGIPVTLSRWQNQDFAVFEVGANQPGELKHLSELLKPDIAIITNIGAAHLAGFGDLAGVARAKSEIFCGLQATGTAILNADSDYFEFCQQQAQPHTCLTIGIDQPADVQARNIKLNQAKQPCFQLVTPNDAIEAQLPLLGKHQVYNALVAAAVAYILGIPLHQIQQGLLQARVEKQRLVELHGINGARIIDDTYNSNPNSAQSALELLASYEGQRIFVLGDMKELGDQQAARYHYELGQKAAQLGIEALYSIGEYGAEIAQGFGAQGKHFKDKATLAETLKQQLDAQTTVLIKASRSMKLETVVQYITSKSASVME